jgi:hypothetical protein
MPVAWTGFDADSSTKRRRYDHRARELGHRFPVTRVPVKHHGIRHVTPILRAAGGAFAVIRPSLRAATARNPVIGRGRVESRDD